MATARGMCGMHRCQALRRAHRSYPLCCGGVRASQPCPALYCPQFVFLDAQGKPLAAAVGRLPLDVLVGNTKALAEGKPLPYARIQAAGASGLQRPDGAMAGPRQTGPLDHS